MVHTKARLEVSGLSLYDIHAGIDLELRLLLQLVLHKVLCLSLTCWVVQLRSFHENPRRGLRLSCLDQADLGGVLLNFRDLELQRSLSVCEIGRIAHTWISQVLKLRFFKIINIGSNLSYHIVIWNLAVWWWCLSLECFSGIVELLLILHLLLFVLLLVN